MDNVIGESKVSGLKLETSNAKQTNHETTEDERIEVKPGKPKTSPFGHASLITRIDMTVFGLFIIGYLLFNVFYWSFYLSL